jgi:hypothetical protein
LHYFLPPFGLLPPRGLAEPPPPFTFVAMIFVFIG